MVAWDGRHVGRRVVVDVEGLDKEGWIEYVFRVWGLVCEGSHWYHVNYQVVVVVHVDNPLSQVLS